MKAQIWFPFVLVLGAGLVIGCSGGDSPRGGDSPSGPNFTGGGAKANDSLRSQSDELTGEEASLVSSGESESDSRQQRPPG